MKQKAVNEECLLTEDSKSDPINPFGRSKLMIEQIMSDYHKAYNMGSSFID